MNLFSVWPHPQATLLFCCPTSIDLVWPCLAYVFLMTLLQILALLSLSLMSCWFHMKSWSRQRTTVPGQLSNCGSKIKAVPNHLTTPTMTIPTTYHARTTTIPTTYHAHLQQIDAYAAFFGSWWLLTFNLSIRHFPPVMRFGPKQRKFIPVISMASIAWLRYIIGKNRKKILPLPWLPPLSWPWPWPWPPPQSLEFVTKTEDSDVWDHLHMILLMKELGQDNQWAPPLWKTRICQCLILNISRSLWSPWITNTISILSFLHQHGLASI